MQAPTVSITPGEELPRTAVAIFLDGTYGSYDLPTQDISICLVECSNPVEKTVEIINHEFIHYILHEEVSKEASIAWDNIEFENPLYDNF